MISYALVKAAIGINLKGAIPSPLLPTGNSRRMQGLLWVVITKTRLCIQAKHRADIESGPHDSMVEILVRFSCWGFPLDNSLNSHAYFMFELI